MTIPYAAEMPQHVRGVIARSKGAPVEIQTVVVPDPGPGEALVAIQACGVCHTDLHYREAGINDDFPFLLGHEAAGQVEAVGEGVTSNVEPGDYVILNWRAVSGNCRACRRGQPQYCFNTHNTTQKMTLEDGTGFSPPSASEPSSRRRWSPPDSARRSIRPRRRPAGRAPRMWGHGRPGRGDQHRWCHTWPVRSRVRLRRRGRRCDRPGASLAGANTIIAVDIDDRKLGWAKEFGATHTCNSTNTDPVEYIRSVTGGFGADVCIEAIGNPAVYRQAFEARDLAGTVVLVGVPHPDHVLELPFIEVFGRGGALKSSWYGDCLPSRDFPMLIDLYLQGRLDLDRFVSETISLDDVEEAFHKMERGEVLRSVVTL